MKRHAGGVKVIKSGRRNGCAAVLVVYDCCGKEAWIKRESYLKRIKEDRAACSRCSKRRKNPPLRGRLPGGVTVLAEHKAGHQPMVNVRYACCGRRGWITRRQYLARVRSNIQQCRLCANGIEPPPRTPSEQRADYARLVARVILAAGGGRAIGVVSRG